MSIAIETTSQTTYLLINCVYFCHFLRETSVSGPTGALEGCDGANVKLVEY